MASILNGPTGYCLGMVAGVIVLILLMVALDRYR